MIKMFGMNTDFLNDDEKFYKALDNLSLYRKEKALKLRMRKDRNLSVGAGVLINEGLKEFGLLEKDMSYGFFKNNKPYFLKHPEIHFNVSHSSNEVIAVFSDSEIGCDIEKKEKADLNIAKRFFFCKEYEYIKSKKTEAEQNDAFFRLWTLKESYIKYLEAGMKLSLNNFFVCIGKNCISAEHNGKKEDLCFYEFDDIKGYCTVVCTKEKNVDVKLRYFQGI